MEFKVSIPDSLKEEGFNHKTGNLSKSAYPPSMAGTVEQISTSHNKQLSEIAVGVET